MRTTTRSPFPGKIRHSYALCFLALAWLMAVPFSLQAQVKKSVLDVRVTYKAQQTPLVKALKDIRTLTNVRFTYNADILRRQPAVTVDAKQQTLEALLKQLLAGTKLQFAEDLGGIVIFPDEDHDPKSGKLSSLLTGQVRGEDGSPLPGITIRAAESNLGTVTSGDGVFSMMVFDEETLKFSGVGFSPLSLRAQKGGGMMVVKMKTSTEEIKEVVVNGYQKIEARMATASIYKLNAADILQPGAASVDQMLQGKVPGLMIMNTSGSVNSAPVIRMRGTSTFVGNASPIWVIDGMIRNDKVPLTSGDISNAVNGNYSLIGSAISGLNPYDIESITFLRDAAATAIYGTRAANGVIVVTTKKGKAGPVQVNYNTDMSFRARPNYNNMQVMNSEQRMNLSRELYEDGMVRNATYRDFIAVGSYEDLVEKLNARAISETEFKQAVQASSARNTDWFKLLFRNSFSMTHSLGISGGSDKSTWYSSVSYTKDNGTGREDNLERYTADVRLNTNIGKRLRTELLVMANYNKANGYATSVNPLSYAMQMSRAISPDANYDWQLPSGTNIAVVPPVTYNFLRDVNNTGVSNSVQSASAILNLHYDLGAGFRIDHASSASSDAAESFKFANEFSPTASLQRGWDPWDIVSNARIAGSTLPVGGLANYSNLNTLTFNTRNSLNYSRMLFRSRDQFNITVGSEIASSQVKGHISQEPGYYPDRGMMFDANENSRKVHSKRELMNAVDNKVGIYAAGAYNMMGRYTLGLTVRSDGSNRFGQYANAKFLPNYGASFRWDVMEERWFKSSNWLDRLSLRATYGTQGNVVSEVGPELIVTFQESTSTPTINGRPRVAVKSLPYPDLRWEKTYQLNLGADIALFANRVSLQVDYYRKRGVDLITRRNIPVENGVDIMYVNAGSMVNNGLEFVLRVVPVQRKDLQVSFTFLNSFNDNSVREKGYKNTILDYLNGRATIPNVPLSGFYSMKFKGLNAQTGLPEFDNLEETGKPVDFDDVLVYSGKKVPDFFGTVVPNIIVKNFTFSANLYYSLGTHKRLNPLFERKGALYGIPNSSSNANRELIGRWRKPGDEQFTQVPVLKDVTSADYVVFPSLFSGTTADNRSPYFLYDVSDIRVANSSFLRCNNMSLRYMVPQRLLGKAVKGLQVGMSIRNVFTIASGSLRGQDPEIDGVGSTALPLPRQYSWNVSANF